MDNNIPFKLQNVKLEDPFLKIDSIPKDKLLNDLITKKGSFRTTCVRDGDKDVMIENIKKILDYSGIFEHELGYNALYTLWFLGDMRIEPQKKIDFAKWFFSKKIDWTNAFKVDSIHYRDILIYLLKFSPVEICKYLMVKYPKVEWFDFITKNMDNLKYTDDIFKKMAIGLDVPEMAKPSPLEILKKIFYSFPNQDCPLYALKSFFDDYLSKCSYHSKEFFEFAISICYNEVIMDMYNNKYKIESKHIDMMINGYNKIHEKYTVALRIIAFINEFYFNLKPTEKQLIFFFDICSRKIKKYDGEIDGNFDFDIKKDIYDDIILKFKKTNPEKQLQFMLLKRLTKKKSFEQILMKDFKKAIADCGKFDEDMIVNYILLIYKTKSRLNTFLKFADYVATPKMLELANFLELHYTCIDILNEKMPKAKAVKKKVIIDSESEEEIPKKKTVKKKVISDTDTSDSESEEETPKKKVVKKTIKKIVKKQT
uniref:Uncharacterized protein n=1 Tax=viral metagenome TaxID=1070528 RepID=A0A6C0EAB3_9ZZZZ